MKDTNKMGENLSFHIWEYLPNSFYILNEPYVRVNMFKWPKISLKNFSEQIHTISSNFIFNPLRALCFACFLQLLFPSNSP